MKRTLVSWSSGKDSAWMLSRLHDDPTVTVAGLVTTINENFERVAMHGVRNTVLERQAASAGVPLWPVNLPWPCSNSDYEARMRALIDRALAAGITHMAFGDLYLEDIRDYRVRQLEGSGIEPLFPIWCGRDGTAALARAMITGGLRASIACLDPSRLDAGFAGASFDASLLDTLPDDVDPCGENGEFHTICTAAPCFQTTLELVRGETVTRDGFVYTDWLLPEQEAVSA